GEHEGGPEHQAHRQRRIGHTTGAGAVPAQRQASVAEQEGTERLPGQDPGEEEGVQPQRLIVAGRLFQQQVPIAGGEPPRALENSPVVQQLHAIAAKYQDVPQSPEGEQTAFQEHGSTLVGASNLRRRSTVAIAVRVSAPEKTATSWPSISRSPPKGRSS